MMKKIIMLFICVTVTLKSQAQFGCTDPQASNFNAGAVINDGSCIYPSTNLALVQKTNLSTPTLDESSGIAFISNSLWTHNDSGNPNSIYRVDTSNGSILQTVVISNATNIDWEDITVGPDYLYIGDFGNNNGNRTDLKIYRIALTALTPAATSVTADIINFSYADQTSFVSAPNNHNFDCESIIYFNDSLHLFSKDWVDKQTRHYVIQATPGTYVAPVKETLNTGNLVTAATIQAGGVIALLGYDKSGLFPVSIWMLYDYHGGLFFNGNKRKFNVSTMLTNGQTEGIEFKNGAYGFVSNERLQQNPFNIAPTIKSFNLAPYLPAAFVYPPPVSAFISDKSIICTGDSINYTDQSLHAPLTWNWLFPGGNPASSNLQNPVVTYTVAGNYPVTLISGNSNGTDTLTLANVVTVAPPPAVTITPNGSLNFCTGGSVLLTSNSPMAVSYQWKKNGTVIPAATGSGFNAATTGTYKVVVTDATGCTKASGSVSVTGPPAASITAGGPLSFCTGDSVVFTAANGNNFSWQWKRNGTDISGATGRTFAAKTKGSYKVTVTNSYSCSSTSSVKKVTVNCREFMPAADEGIRVYPNPAQETVTITGISDGDLLQIFDVNLRQVFDSESSSVIFAPNQVTLPIAFLKPGIYMILVTGKDKHLLRRFSRQ